MAWNGDVVLADEVVGLGGGIFPPRPPRLGIPLALRPLLRGGQVADDRLEPHVDAFARPQVVDRQWHPPLQVAGDGTIVQSFLDEADRPVLHVLAPPGAALEPLQERLGEGGQQQEVVLGVSHHGNSPAHAAAGGEEVLRVEGAAAVVALVAARFPVPAVGTGPLHVSVGEKTRCVRVVELAAGALADVALLQEAQEQVVGHPAMVVGPGVGVQVPRDAQVLPLLEELGVVPVHDLLRRYPFLVGPHCDRGAVDVAAGHHQHPVARHAVIAGEDVRRQVGARQMAQMPRAAGIRPGNRNEDVARRAHEAGGYQRPALPSRPRSARRHVLRAALGPVHHQHSQQDEDAACGDSQGDPLVERQHAAQHPHDGYQIADQ